MLYLFFADKMQQKKVKLFSVAAKQPPLFIANPFQCFALLHWCLVAQFRKFFGHVLCVVSTCVSKSRVRPAAIFHVQNHEFAA